MFPGNGDAQPLTENPRKYVMGHFRWDRFGRRNGSSSGGGGGGGGAGQKREEEEVAAGEGPGPRGDGVAPGPRQDKRSYSMEHFRWGSPPKDKRYGGFMTSEKSQTPLVTLFKNAIVKNAHKKGQ